MNTHQTSFTLRVTVIAARSGLVAMVAAAGVAHAADAAVTELTTPANVIELGVANVGRASYKAQEFTGVRDKGAYLIGNVDLRGGDAYDSGQAFRWRLAGRDLGLDRRSLLGEVGVQGRYRLDLNYDELRRNRSDSYQSPYLGIGTHVLTLPSTWLVPLVPRVSVVTPRLAPLAGPMPAAC